MVDSGSASVGLVGVILVLFVVVAAGFVSVHFCGAWLVVSG